ncbi:amidohydrolase family protein [Rhodohalobacter sp. 614A]|uniref:amidohydrolase family protein n=1 Tax=Rhodohalobacter sp. 614A TaxID=2908649 RepID=UPI001F42BE8F|nr:amidohydrolase family protein [Rhodohalobacter sp. 614A]
MKKAVLLTFTIVCMSAQLLFAQITEKPEFGKFAITNATIHTVTNGTIEGGIVLIEDNSISFVGQNARIPNDYTTIDATDKHVYPGFIDANTRLGLEEVASVSLTQDYAEVGDFNPHMKAFTAVNPNSASIPVTRVNGITNVVAIPASGVIAGKAVLLNLWGYTPDDMAVKPSAGLHIEWPSAMKGGFWDSRSDEEVQKEFEEDLKELNDFWKKAAFYDEMMNEYELDPGNRSQPDKNTKMEAMREVVSGEVPVIISVNSEKDIKNALEWAEENEDVSVIFAGVSEGWRVAEELAEAEIPVITSSQYTITRDYDNYQRPYQNAGLMAEAGVKVMISTGEGVENVRNVGFHAGYAAAYGMGKEEALKAVTINPAEAFGVGDQLGSIEEGKTANLFISDGDPFEPMTHIEYVFINGYKIPMTSRHDQLYEEFLDRDAVNR